MTLYKFIGKNGSMGLINGKEYDLEQEDSYGTDILLRVTNPKNKLSGISIPYGSINAFCRNWKMK